MIYTKIATIQDVGILARLVDALLVELSGKESRYAERLQYAAQVLELDQCIFGYIAFNEDKPVGCIMVSENFSIYAGGAFGVITELFTFLNTVPME